MTDLTETAGRLRKTLPGPIVADRSPRSRDHAATSKETMLQLIITLLIVVGLGYALRTDRRARQIARTPYNNRYNDAAGAREDHLG